ncbi:Na+/H+ antiporter subunit G [Longimycelium tulufanense]|uniref:Na+/H+ antiporter subunit G n=1 Tax=Longimycelium tulufanense TaxID=907463 RepID=A0A8J3FTZ0_9PSEU|nr:monovalent cation/H(+) antiporter subunit G [Longimycelium tulufanense]GGM50760.1 Na+/H+ antiporter subunit G [Longimycelium tulufanense]
MTAPDIVSAVTLLAGATFCLLGAIGVVRFPDTAARLHAAAKPQTLGLLLILLGTAIRVPADTVMALLLVALLQLTTTPVTAQIVGRAAHRIKAMKRPNVVLDELGTRDQPPAPPSTR